MAMTADRWLETTPPGLLRIQEALSFIRQSFAAGRSPAALPHFRSSVDGTMRYRQIIDQLFAIQILSPGWEQAFGIGRTERPAGFARRTHLFLQLICSRFALSPSH